MGATLWSALDNPNPEGSIWLPGQPDADPFAENVGYLFHFDDANGTTLPRDEITSNTVSTTSPTEIMTQQDRYKYAPGSLRYASLSESSQVLRTQFAADIVLVNSIITLEGWFYYAQSPIGTNVVVAGVEDNASALRIAADIIQQVSPPVIFARFRMPGLAANGIRVAINSATYALGWHHLAATYDGTTARLFMDGQLIASEVASLSNRTVQRGYLIDSDSSIDIGTEIRLDDCRFTANVARYTSNFTPPGVLPNP